MTPKIISLLAREATEKPAIGSTLLVFKAEFALLNTLELDCRITESSFGSKEITSEK